MARSAKRDTPRFLSLFCGCGGFDLGFRQAGLRCVAALDVDPVAVGVHRLNLGQTAEVCDLSNGVSHLDRIPRVDVVIAGPPCQGFSTAGKRNPDDPRNSLLAKACQIAVRVRPTVFVLENVSGVVAGAHRAHWEAVTRRLRASGYRTADVMCHAARAGVAQTRRRMLLLAWRNGREVDVAFPALPTPTLGDVIANINGAASHDPRPLTPGSRAIKIAARIGPGQKLCNVRGGEHSVHTWDIPEVFGRTNGRERAVLEGLLRLRRRCRLRDVGDADPVTATMLRQHVGRPVAETLRCLLRKGYVRHARGWYDLAHTFNGKFRRLQWDRPSLTVDTRFGDPRYFLHPEEHRGFTVREAARIQGFPDSYRFTGSERAQYRLIGNAVPPPMALCIAKYIRTALLG